MDIRGSRGGRAQDRKFFAALADDLTAHIEQTVQYDSPGEGGETRRERNARFGMPSPDPIAPPEGAEHLLRAFWSLHRLRRGGVNGPDPIQPRDIADWCAVTGNHLRSEEIDLIFRMDATYLATVQTLTVNKSDASVSIAEGPSI